MAPDAAELPVLNTAALRLDKAYFLLGLALAEAEQAFRACSAWAAENSDHQYLPEIEESISQLMEDLSHNEFISYHVYSLVAKVSGNEGIELTYEQDKRLSFYMKAFEEAKAKRAA